MPKVVPFRRGYRGWREIACPTPDGVVSHLDCRRYRYSPGSTDLRWSNPTQPVPGCRRSDDRPTVAHGAQPWATRRNLSEVGDVNRAAKPPQLGSNLPNPEDVCNDKVPDGVCPDREPRTLE